MELGEQEGWTVERLGQIAQVFNGPRFKRPYADKGVTSGPDIVRYFTGNAVTQTLGENIKYLDLGKAKPAQLRMIQKLLLRRGMILVTDSGTVGRVVYATSYHDGAVGTNNLIRVVIEDEALRGYVYQFLSSELGQHQLKANIYGAIVDHIEPDEAKNVFVPLPDDRSEIERIGLPVIQSIDLQEKAQMELERSRTALAESVGLESAITDDGDGDSEFSRFEELTQRLVQVPKSEVDALREAEHDDED
jgi:type I restriction enzyme M protein